MALRAGAQAGVPFSAELESQSGESGYREIKTSRHRILCLLDCFLLCFKPVSGAGQAGREARPKNKLINCLRR